MMLTAARLASEEPGGTSREYHHRFDPWLRVQRQLIERDRAGNQRRDIDTRLRPRPQPAAVTGRLLRRTGQGFAKSRSVRGCAADVPDRLLLDRVDETRTGLRVLRKRQPMNR